jgi:hypothetical protein
VTLDPRVVASQSDLVKQLDAEISISAQMSATYDGSDQVQALRTAIADRQKLLATDATKKEAADALKALDDQAADIGDGKPEKLGLGPLNRELARLAFMIESGDARPATLLQAGVDQSCEDLEGRLKQWRELNQQKIPSENALLQKQNLPALPITTKTPAGPKCEK